MGNIGISLIKFIVEDARCSGVRLAEIGLSNLLNPISDGTLSEAAWGSCTLWNGENVIPLRLGSIFVSHVFLDRSAAGIGRGSS